MSGGYFDYKEYHINEIIEELEGIIREAETDNSRGYDKGTIEEFKIGKKCLERAHIYVCRIDKLLSGDHSEDSFHENLDKDLDNLGEL